MIGIAIVSHESLATELYKTASLFCADNEGVVTVELKENDSAEQFGESLSSAIAQLKTKEVLILCDLTGGTPCNQSLLFAAEHSGAQVLAGMNLIMVLEAMSNRSSCETAKELAREALDAARLGIVDVLAKWNEKNASQDDAQI